MGCNGISPFLWNTIYVCTLFKNCGNLSLNSAGVYLYNSELTLSYPFFINLKAFSDSSDVIKVCVIEFHFGSFTFVVFHTLHSTEE